MQFKEKENQVSHRVKFQSEYKYSSLRLTCIIFIPYIHLVLVGKISYRKNILTKLMWSEIWLWHRNPTFSIQSTWRIFFFIKQQIQSFNILLNGKEIPTKAKYHDKTFYICYLFCVELCQTLLTDVEKVIMLLKSRSRTRHQI